MNQSVIRNTACCAVLELEGLLEVVGDGNTIEASVVGGNASLLLRAGASLDFGGGQFFGGAILEAGAELRAVSGLTLEGLELELSADNLDRPAIVGESQSTFFLGDLRLDGEIVLRADGLSNVEAGQEYLIASADLLSLDLDGFDLPELPQAEGGMLELVPRVTETTLSVVVVDASETLPGDYNGDAAVDAADFTRMRDESSQLALPVDHWVWKSNYGRTRDLARQQPPFAIPEPASVGLLLAGVAVGRFRRRAEVG